MSKKNRKKRLSKANIKRQSRNLEISKTGRSKKKYLVYGLKNMDANQGQNFENWEEDGILVTMLNRLKEVSTMTLNEAIEGQIIKIYGQGIPKGSDFEHPKHIPDDTEWASIRIQGEERIIGFIEDGFVFQVVFLDKEHKFYPSNKKNT